MANFYSGLILLRIFKIFLIFMFPGVRTRGRNLDLPSESDEHAASEPLDDGE